MPARDAFGYRHAVSLEPRVSFDLSRAPVIVQYHSRGATVNDITCRSIHRWHSHRADLVKSFLRANAVEPAIEEPTTSLSAQAYTV